MKILHKMFVAAVGAGVLLTGCSTGQPSPGCYLQSHSNWFFAYDRTSASPQCGAANTTAPRLRGERVGVFKYRTPGQTDATVVFRPAGVTTGDAGDPADEGAFTGGNAAGAHADEPDAERFCAVADMSPAVSAVDATATMPEGTRRYEFTQVKTYAGARSLGQQLVAKLRYTEPGTNPASPGDCVMEFDVKGVWAGFVPSSCNPDIQPGSPEAEATPLTTCGPGSTANQDIVQECRYYGDSKNAKTGVVTKLGRCVPANEVPSYREGVEEIDYAD